MPQPSAPQRGGAPASTALFAALAAITTILYGITIWWVFMRAPIEKTMGIVQKIFYFHVPSAYCMYIGATACFIGSLLYLLRPTVFRDALGRAGAETAVVFGAIMLTTGPLWAVKSWGVYWKWDPQLTTALLSVLLYIAYLVLRAFAGDGEGERKFAAALGVVGFANLPIIHFAVRKWSGTHPEVVRKTGGGLAHADMRIAFALAMITFTIFAVLVLWARVRIELAKSRLATVEEDAVELGLDTRAEA